MRALRDLELLSVPNGCGSLLYLSLSPSLEVETAFAGFAAGDEPYLRHMSFQKFTRALVK